MSVKTAVLCIALGVGAGLVPGIGSARTYIDIDIAPPAPREEVIPAPRRSYDCASGCWNYRHHRHAWVRGHWVHGRRGHHYVAAHWEQRGHRWHFEQGHWD